MGTTLASLHIFTDDIESVKAYISKEYNAYNISKGWVSVQGNDLGSLEKEARTLSRSIDFNILAFFYFDDDLLALILFQNGKKTANYEMTYSGGPYVKNLKAFMSAFKLEALLEKRLHDILQCSDITKKTEMLEEFFGVALYVHPDAFEDRTDNYVRIRGNTAYSAYKAAQKKLESVKNSKKPVLTQEINGTLMYFFNHPAQNSKDYLLYAENDDDTERCCFVELIGDNFVKHSVDIPHYAFPELYETNDGWILKHHTCYFISKDGSSISKIDLPKGI